MHVRQEKISAWLQDVSCQLQEFFRIFYITKNEITQHQVGRSSWNQNACVFLAHKRSRFAQFRSGVPHPRSTTSSPATGGRSDSKIRCSRDNMGLASRS